MRWSFGLGSLDLGSFGLAGAFVCAATMQAHPSVAAVQQEVDCHEFTKTVTIDGLARQAAGEACRQPDGSWQIVQEDTPTANAPPQAYAYPYPYPYSYSYPYPYYWTDGWGPPFFGSVFFVDRFGRSRFFHHDFRHFHHGDFRHGGFHSHGNGGGRMMGGRGGGGMMGGRDGGHH